MSEDKRSEVLWRDLKDIKQVLEQELVIAYKQRILGYLAIAGEMKENDTWTILPLERPEYRRKEGLLNAFSRWLFWTAFQELKKEGTLEPHHHGKGKPIIYTKKEA